MVAQGYVAQGYLRGVSSSPLDPCLSRDCRNSEIRFPSMNMGAGFFTCQPKDHFKLTYSPENQVFHSPPSFLGGGMGGQGGLGTKSEEGFSPKK